MTGYRLTLSLISPFMTGGSAEPAFGIDARLARNNATQRRPVIPGTLLRGLLRDALLSMAKRGGGTLPGFDKTATRALLNGLFGRGSGVENILDDRREPPDEYAKNQPQRGALRIADLIATQSPDEETTLTRIEIEPNAGSVREGHLQVLELPWPIGVAVAFSGELHLGRAVRPEAFEKLWELARQALTSLGAHKSAGFGRIVSGSARLTRDAPWQALAAAPAPPPRAATLSLAIDGPFLVDAERVAPNLFRGAAAIPGGVLKGAFADALHGGCADALAACTFHQALPGPLVNGKNQPLTPCAAPFSLGLFKAEGETPDHFHDLAREKTACIDAHDRAPVFQVDWKPQAHKALKKMLHAQGIAPLTDLGTDRELRTRTAITYDYGTAKYEEDAGGSLFSYNLVKPSKDGAPLQWHFKIAAPDAMPDADFPAFLQALAQQPIFFGKLNTRAVITKIQAHAPPPLTLTAGPVVLVLQTPALLSPLEDVRAAGGDIGKVYAEYFKAREAAGLTLLRFFARQRLVGGYQAMRYRADKAPYAPYIATLPGSVFVLNVEPAKAQAAQTKIAEWLTFGLPVNGDFLEPHWKTCPMPRENGYGAVALAPKISTANIKLSDAQCL